MDHHRQHHHQPPRHNNHPPRQHQQHHHPPHIIPSPSSSRYLPPHPPPPHPPPPLPQPPPPQLSIYPPHHHHHHHHPNLSPPFRPDFPFINSPPHHPHPRDDHLPHHRDMVFRSHPFDDIPNHNHSFVDDVDRHRFRLNELPPQPPPLPPPPPPPPQHPRVSPVARRSPNQFAQFDRFGRQFDTSPPPPPPSRFREDMSLDPRVRLQQHNDSIEYHHQLRRERVEDDRRVLGVVDRLEGGFEHDWNRSIDHDRGRERERDHHEKYYPEMVSRNEFEPNSGNSEYMNDEVLMRERGGANVGRFEENVNKRYGGGREVSRSPIKFRIGGVVADDRFSNRGRKEDVQEYNTSVNNRNAPKKILQKKSAFLRIQQPGKPQHHSSSNFRNRFDNSASPGPHKGKESTSEFVDTRIGEERVGSPVELDVSFKSNALVAKAIMAAPPSTSGVGVNVHKGVSSDSSKVVSESQAKLGSQLKVESQAKVASLKKKSVAVLKKDDKNSKIGVKVSPIMKRVGKSNNVEVHSSESPPSGSSSLSGGITRKVAPKGKVVGKVDKNAGTDKLSSLNIRKKRKASGLLSRLSNPMPTSTNADCGLVNVDSTAGRPSEGSMPFDISVKKSEEELSCGSKVIGSTQNKIVDMGQVDINETPTVMDQQEVVGELLPESSAPKRILESFPDSSGSLSSGVTEGCGNPKGFGQVEQRFTITDEDETKFVEKCNSDIHLDTESVKVQDMAAMLASNGSVEGTSELASVCMVENVENNAVCSGNLNTLNSVPLMSFISNSFINEVDLMCPKVDAEEPCETQVLSSPDNATIGLSLGGLYADRNDEPRLRYSEDISRLVSFSNEVNKHCKSQAFSSPENATVGLSLGGLYSDRKFESDIGHSEDNAKLESFSKDISSDKRTLLSYDDDVTISLTNLNTTDIRITNDTQEQQTQGSDVLVNDETMLGKEEAPDTCIGAGGVLPSVKKGNILFNRKRKVGTEQDSLGSRIPESCHESRVSLSFPIENAMFPLEECCSAISGPPCDEPNVSKRIDYTGSCIEGMDSINPIGDLDKIDNFIIHGKKRKILPEYSVVSDAPGSKTSDLPPAEPTLLPQAGGSVANVFPQLTEGVELQKSEITGEDTTGAASGSLCAETCSFAHNSNSDSLCNDSCLLVTECAPPNADKPSSPESRCNQKISANFMTGKGDDENGFIVLESSCRITADVNSDLLCLSNDHTENVNQGPLAINMESNDNGTVTNDGNSGLSRLSADHTEKVDQVPLAINTESDDNGMATNNGNSGLSCFSVDLSGNESQGPLVMSVEYDDSRMTTKDGNSGFPCLLAAQNGDDYQGSSAVNMECNDNITLNAESTYDGVTTNSDILDKRPDVDFPEDCSYLPPTLDISNASPDLHVISGEKVSIGDQKSNQSSAIQTSFCPQPNLLPENHINSSKPGNSVSSVQPFSRISVPLPSKNVKTTMASSSSYRKLRRNVLTRSEATPSTSQRSPPINPSNKTNTYPGKPRTWNRTNSLAASNIPVKKPPVAAPPHRPPYGKAMKVQDTSYIRKGNSLVRNPVSAISSAGSLALGASTSGSRALGASIDRSKPYDTYRTKKVVGSVTESTELPDGFVAGGQRAPIEMSKTPPLSCSGKTSDNDVVCLGECTSSFNVDQTEGTDKEEAIKSSESNSLRDSESVLSRDLEDTGIFSDGVLGSSSKKMVYIKRKSNQLIAASKSSQFSVHDMGKTAASSSDINYYKRRKNQLIRASSDGNIQQMVAVIKDTSKSLSQRAPNVYGRNSTKKPSNKGKSQKLSLVWKLGDSKASGKGVDALKSRRLLSHLLPWKRATYWSRKPLSSRKRGAVYVRSGRGFSLRRSKVTSLPGTSLKWSKSMEKRSKKVEEEAALAVAELDSVQKSGSSGVCSKAASNIHSVHNAVHSLKLHPGERIFRIGVYRYRMDPSRKTLHRISDEEISDFTASKSEKDARKTYVPKRLLIGSDEYVRIGNGNQLVRDPKKRTRILASEKVRWSLHTARMRLAKKRKFCQFFTRFGKCNKGEGKCPYIHDPSKVAVCTKFLNGLCADPNCKLTHKVIPERMPDCSFYLQGLCSNEKCPYRHVNVNPKASICENFLRGYCAEGNECRKKHSYICPDFEACGSCPQGSKCKLYHPKKCKAKKRKISRDHNNAKGRYFGSDLSLVVEPEKHIEPSEGNMCIEEDFGDFISLDVVDDDDEAHENSGLTSEQSFLCEDDPLNSEFNDLDELIKPLSIIGTL